MCVGKSNIYNDKIIIKINRKKYIIDPISCPYNHLTYGQYYHETRFGLSPVHSDCYGKTIEETLLLIVSNKYPEVIDHLKDKVMSIKLYNNNNKPISKHIYEPKLTIKLKDLVKQPKQCGRFGLNIRDWPT